MKRLALIFDTETNGKIKKWGQPVSDVNNYPRISQIAWQVVDLDTEEIVREEEYLIFPDGWTIPTVEEQIAKKEKNPYFFVENNMSTERCREFGEPIDRVLDKFIEVLEMVMYVVAHNIDFDVPVVSAEMLRLQMFAEAKPKRICTMKISTPYLRLLPKKFGQYKYPTLAELYKRLTGKDFENAHDAMSDVNGCRVCFFALRKKRIIHV